MAPSAVLVLYVILVEHFISSFLKEEKPNIIENK